MEKILKGLRLPVDIIERVESYQKEKYIQSFTQAVIQLILKGLENVDK